MENNAVFYPGRHVLADYYGCTPALLNDAVFLEQLLLQSAEIMGATIVSVQFNKFNPIGVSGVIIIAESHLTLHSWPEHGFAAVDFFTCGEMPYETALAHIRKGLEAAGMEVNILNRGIEKNMRLDG